MPPAPPPPSRQSSVRSVAHCNERVKSSRRLGGLRAGLDTAFGQVPAPARPLPLLATVLLLSRDFRRRSIISDYATGLCRSPIEMSLFSPIEMSRLTSMVDTNGKRLKPQTHAANIQDCSAAGLLLRASRAK